LLNANVPPSHTFDSGREALNDVVEDTLDATFAGGGDCKGELGFPLAQL